MAQVIIQINGRNYTMQCDDGQEEHLRRLARMIDDEIASIRNAVGSIGDLRLLIMASLVIADRLTEVEKQVAWLEEQLEELRTARKEVAGQIAMAEERAAKTLEAAARRLESLAATARQKMTADDAAPSSGG